MDLNRGADKRLDEIVAHLLKAGVLLSAAIIFIGGILFLMQYGGTKMDYRIFHGEPSELRSVTSIVRFAFSGHRRGLIQLGLLVLMATPVARVLFAMVAFGFQRDRMYFFISLLVFTALCFSLLAS